MENPNSKEVQEYMEENKNMKEAREKLDRMSEDERVRRLAELRQKAIMDEREAEYTGYSKGLKEGEKRGEERGLERGLEEGIKQGEERGIRQGYRERNREIARKMKENGMDIEIIMQITELTKEEIEEL